MIGKAIHGILSAAPAITTLVSTRIFPVLATAGSVFPYAVYNVVTSRTNSTKTSIGDRDQTRVQIDIYSKTYSEAEDIGRKARIELEGYEGTVSGVVIEKIDYLSENDGLEELQEAFRKSYDYQIYIKL